MRTIVRFPVAVVLLAGPLACNQSQSPGPAQVAAAGREDKVVVGDSNYDLVITRAEAEHQIAIENCGAVEGAAQMTCEDKADAALDIARKQADAARNARP